MDKHMVTKTQSDNSNTITLPYDEAIYNAMKIYCLHHFHFKEFPINWEQNILNLLPKIYKKKYCSLIELLFKETKDIYVKYMQDFAKSIVLSNPSTGQNYFSVKTNLICKCINEGTAYKHGIFLKCRKSLEKRYYLFLEPIKIILNEAQAKLPIIICNFEHYHHFGLMSLTDFQNMIMNDVKKGSVAITNQFYNGISKVIAESKVLKDINSKKLPSIMRCITHIFIQQILNVMIKSIDHILNLLSDGYHCPQLKFKLILRDSQLLVSPGIQEIYSVYHSIIEKIGAIGQDLIPLEEWLNIKTHVKYIKVALPEWYIKESNNRLLAALDNLFNSVNKHVAKISTIFNPICAPSLKEQILSLTAGKVDFDFYLENIQNYNTYLTKANTVALNTYHAIGKLEQYEGMEALKCELRNIINALLDKLITYHQEFNLSICSAFENLKTKALDIPRDPKLLIRLSDDISHAKQDLIPNLTNQTQKSIHMTILLSEITHLSEDHIQLNIRTINWLHEIEPILKQSNILSEAMRTELEDDMQNRISNLNAEVDNIVPQLYILDNMDDINNTEEYVAYYKGLLKQANQIMYEMLKINEEENLFKFPETEFPNVTEIHILITSLSDLIFIIYQWQKDHSVWLDGPFEWLNAPLVGCMCNPALKKRHWVEMSTICNFDLTPNAHWMIQLERICEHCSTFNVSLNFRLWLSSYSIKEFPISILQSCLKIVHDYPLNVKDSLLNTYQSESIINKDFFDSCPGKDKTFLQLLFGICLFHSVLQEKRTFRIQEWNILHIFDHTDLQISIMQLQNFINNTDHVPFNILLYLIGECNYGAKVEDEFDKKYLKNLLSDYCNSNIVACHQRRYSNTIEKLIPQMCEYHDTIQHIKKLDFSPQMLGSNRYSVYIRNTVIGTEFLSSLSCMIYPMITVGEELHQDEILTLINSIRNKLCNSIKINKIQDECTSMVAEPFQRVLLYEIKSLEHVLKTISESLNTLELALNGSLPFTNSLKEFAEEIYKHKVPYVWMKSQIHVISTNLPYYIDNLLKHACFINNWLNEGFPKVIWFDALFHCKMFFSAISLILLKKINISDGEPTFDIEVMTKKIIDTKTTDTYVISGLKLFGACWDSEKNILIDNCTNETWQNMPPICLTFLRNKKGTDNVYNCPIYFSAVKPVDNDIKNSSSYIFSIPLKTNMPRAHWIKCGTALFCHVPK